jgi:hypothetical protein
VTLEREARDPPAAPPLAWDPWPEPVVAAATLPPPPPPPPPPAPLVYYLPPPALHMSWEMTEVIDLTNDD